MMRMVIHLFVQSEMKAENLFRQMNFGTCDRLTRDVGVVVVVSFSSFYHDLEFSYGQRICVTL